MSDRRLVNRRLVDMQKDHQIAFKSQKVHGKPTLVHLRTTSVRDPTYCRMCWVHRNAVGNSQF